MNVYASNEGDLYMNLKKREREKKREHDIASFSFLLNNWNILLKISDDSFTSTISLENSQMMQEHVTYDSSLSSKINDRY
jgi:hypothetical protein